MTPGTLLRLALAGTRTDAVRVALTAVSAALAALAVLAAATVLAIPAGPAGGSSAAGAPSPVLTGVVAGPYRSNLLAEAGLRPGVALALVLLTIPVLALAAQCGRLGAPARDRRLAAVRLAGGTPRQVVVLVVAESAVASTLGVAVGFAAYFTGRATLHRPDAAGRLALPTDVLPPLPVLLGIGVGLPLAAVAIAALLLRRVAVTPFGVVRRTRSTAPRPWPGLLIVIGVGMFGALGAAGRATRQEVPGQVVVVFVGALAALVGVVLGTGWISYRAGRLLHRVARRPAPLLAARRLMADPWSGSRTFAALLACVLFGAGAAQVRAWLAASFAAEAALFGSDVRDTSFYFDALNLVDAAVLVATAVAAAGLLVALAEGIVSRRRTYTALVATGVPRATLARATLWQVMVPVVPAVAVALAVGVALVQSLSGANEAAGRSQRCDASGCVDSALPDIPVPLGRLALLGSVTLAVVLVVVGIGLLFLRSSTAVEELRTA